jgi:hypothetical protein
VLIVYHTFFRFATPLTQLFVSKVLTFKVFYLKPSLPQRELPYGRFEGCLS